MGESPDPAAVEAVAKAIYATSPWNDAGSATNGHGASAQAAIAALSALGWVEGTTHREIVAEWHGMGMEMTELIRERDALRAALEKITRLPIYGHDPQDAIALATAAITAAKDTP